MVSLRRLGGTQQEALALGEAVARLKEEGGSAQRPARLRDCCRWIYQPEEETPTYPDQR